MSDSIQLSADELAQQRTVMALDRTLMAWTRTSLSLISFGFTIYKFLQYARQEGQIPIQVQTEGPRHMGMAMIGLGVIFLVLASLSFWREIKILQPNRRFPAIRLSLAMAVLLALLGLLALMNIVIKVGPF